MYLGYNKEKSFRGHIWQMQMLIGTLSLEANEHLMLNFCRIDGFWSNYYSCYPLCPDDGQSLINGVCADNSSVSYNAKFDFKADDEKVTS